MSKSAEELADLCEAGEVKKMSPLECAAVAKVIKERKRAGKWNPVQVNEDDEAEDEDEGDDGDDLEEVDDLEDEDDDEDEG